MAAKPFRTSFLDGFTGEGIFGDLRLPGAPTRMFISEEEAAAKATESMAQNRLILVLLAETRVEADELGNIRVAVQRALNETTKAKVKVVVPDAATEAERYAAG